MAAHRYERQSSDCEQLLCIRDKMLDACGLATTQYCARAVMHSLWQARFERTTTRGKRARSPTPPAGRPPPD